MSFQILAFFLILYHFNLENVLLEKKLWIRFLTLLSKLDWTYFQNGQNVELLKLFTGAEEGFSEVFFFLFAKPYLGKIFQIFFNNTDSGLKVGRFVPYFILRLFQGVL